MSASTISKATIADAVAQLRMDGLDKIAHEAWVKWPGKDAGTARRDHVAGHLKLELTWALVEHYQPNTLTQAVGWLLNRGKELYKTNKNTSISLVSGGHVACDTLAAPAPANPSRDTAKAVGGGQERGDTQARRAPANLSPEALKKAAQLKVLADKQQDAEKYRAKTELRLSRLDTVMVFGKTIGKCTVAEVRKWIEARQVEKREAGRDVRFASILIANLPSNAVIGEHWKSADEVNKYYADAEAEHAA